MGAAGVVPGLDGGTAALVLGIFDRLVASLRAGATALGLMLRGRFAVGWRRLGDVEWGLLLPLLIGFAIAVVTLARVITHLLETYPHEAAGAAFGLLCGAIVLAARQVDAWTPKRLAFAAAAAVAVFALLGVQSGSPTDPGLWLFFLAGVVGVSGMIVPGVSGAAILLAVGLYQPLLDAVNARDLAVIGVFAIGAVIGLAILATFLDRWLTSHRSTLLAWLVGFMIGSLRMLWPWPDGTDSAVIGAPTDWLVPLLLAIAGFALVTVFSHLTRAEQSL